MMNRQLAAIRREQRISTMTVFEAGVSLSYIPSFDRSTHVHFMCKEHPERGTWISKDPAVSNWFPLDKAAEETTTLCRMYDCNLVLTEEYDNGMEETDNEFGNMF